MRGIRHIALLLAWTAILRFTFFVPAFANPQGGQVVGGSATIGGQGTATVTVNQSSQNAVINWQSFNIGAGETTQFIQPNSAATVLNRVTGDTNPSQIFGTLSANGRVFLINPNGVLIGNGATINTAGFLATTHDIANSDFMAGRYNFNIPGNPSASVVNLGTITATGAGFAALVAPGVRNSGTIVATYGRIGLASANGFTLDPYGDQLLTLSVSDSIAAQVTDVATGQTLQSLVQNDGTLSANGGRVELTAVAARQVVDSVINNEGVIEARSIGTKSGRIVLGAATAAAKPTGAPKQTVRVSGTLRTASADGKGGTIKITGEDIKVAGATLDASGLTGGGKVLIGGDVGGGNPSPLVTSLAQAQLEAEAIPNATTVSIDAATTIDASATGSGDGGKVVVWADGATAFAGSITARGGADGGNGGFVEVSGKEALAFSGLADTRAPFGEAGTLLLDPANFTIGSKSGWNKISAAALQDLLALGDVVITNNAGAGDGDIIVATNLTWGSGPTAQSSLTLSAYRHIAFKNGTTVTNTGVGDFILRADNTGIGTGRVKFFGTGPQIVSSGSGNVDVFYNPARFGTPDFKDAPVQMSGSGILTHYMLVNTAENLQAISGNLAGNYALGRDIDLDSVSNFTPIGSFQSGGFTGKFDGGGFTIDNLTIAPNSSDIVSVGLFGVIGGGGHVHDLNLTNASVQANTALGSFGQAVGVLAGTNYGTIDNVRVQGGSVTGGTFQGLMAGGLVGLNEVWNGQAAVVRNSSSSAAVAVGDSGACGETCGTNYAGGLVGYNRGLIEGAVQWIYGPWSYPIWTTYATGMVSVGSNGVGGGLVGYNDGIIDRAFASGRVTGSAGTSVLEGDIGGTVLGGLVGANLGEIKRSWAAGTVGSSNVDNLIAGGLAGVSSGTIESSTATGQVRAGNASIAGGLVGDGAPRFDVDWEAANGVGSNNDATVTGSQAFGSVRVGDVSLAGGLVGFAGNIRDSSAFGNVTGGIDSILGGLAAVLPVAHVIANGDAWGNVAGGSNSWIGGLVGVNAGMIGPRKYGEFQNPSTSRGWVFGASNSLLGGLVGLNVGGIYGASPISSSNVSTWGNGNIVGGLVGANFGTVDHADSSGHVFAFNESNIAGSLVGANGAMAGVLPAQIPGSTFPFGTAYNSTGTGAVNGSAGSQVGTTNLASMPQLPGVLNACNDALCNLLKNPQLIPAPDIPEQLAGFLIFVSLVDYLLPPAPPSNPPIVLASLTEPGTGPGPGPGPGTNPPIGPGGAIQNATPGQTTFIPPPLPPRMVTGLGGETLSGMPALTETRFVQNQVLLQMSLNLPTDQLLAAARALGIQVLTNESLSNLGQRVISLQLPPGMSVRQAIALMERNPNFPLATINGVYRTSQAEPAMTKGDPAQYTLAKLNLEQVHPVATGRGVTIAVIDSEVDKRHSELQGAISEELNALGAKATPHSHGTAMAGAIASRDRLLGVAPNARILAVRAFGESNNTAEGTSLTIIKGIEWAVSQGAKVINMSFAGPRDPALERALKAARDKGVVLIAAAGNAGPKSPPLYPAADPNVIAVTATDVRDRIFRGAVQGPQVSVSAPGVDVLAPAPDAAYQMSTGTSIATAHVSGVVALMLERNPNLKPAEIRQILESTATDLGTKGKDTQFGWGLVNPGRALTAVNARRTTTDASGGAR